MIFLSFLEFINQLLLVEDGALPINTYEVKKFLRDMGLGYEKIPACLNDCMLFWKDNKDLDSCVKCGKSKWKDKIHFDKDGQPRNVRSRYYGGFQSFQDCRGCLCHSIPRII
jgi:Zn ribbon nucleic-acid-binding protein